MPALDLIPRHELPISERADKGMPAEAIEYAFGAHAIDWATR